MIRDGGRIDISQDAYSWDPGIFPEAVLFPSLIIQDKFLSTMFQFFTIAFQVAEALVLGLTIGMPYEPQLYFDFMILTQSFSGLFTICQASLAI